MKRFRQARMSRLVGSALVLAATAVVIAVLVLPATAFGKRAKGAGNESCKARLDNISPKQVELGKNVMVFGSHLSAGHPSGKGEFTYKTSSGINGTTGNVVGGVLTAKLPTDAVTGLVWAGSSECPAVSTRLMVVGG